jgi:hypothetical protein
VTRITIFCFVFFISLGYVCLYEQLKVVRWERDAIWPWS